MKFIFAAITAFFLSSAHSGQITIDFEGLPQGTFKENVSVSGFVFSPSCHLDVLNTDNVGSPAPSGTWVGYDMSGCLDGAVLPTYLGGATGPIPGTAMMYIAGVNGQLFDLVSFIMPTIAAGSVYSSAGGVMQLWAPAGDVTTFTFDGPEWRGLTSLLFVQDFVGAPVAIDNLVLVVPEPGTLAIVLGGLSALVLVRSRRSSR